MIRYQAKIARDGKRYSVEFPDLPGCFSEGATRQEALEHAREALSLYLENVRSDGSSLPARKTRRSKQYVWVSPYVDVAVPLLLRQARRDAGYSQREMADKLGVSVQQLQKLETPRKSNPTVKMLARISVALERRLLVELAA